jgi:predicted kinase
MIYNLESTPPALILIRGVSGSGKTTLAKQLAALIPDSVHFEIDMFHGIYENGWYKGHSQRAAYVWLEDQTWKWLNDAKTVIVADNFIRNSDMAPYFKMAKRCNFDVFNEVVVIECKGNSKSDHWEPLDYDEVLGLK